MLKQARRFVRHRLKSVGLERIRHPSFIRLMSHHNIQTVIDVGANDGFFGAELRAEGYRGRIVSFEPVSTIFDRLEARTAKDPKWTAHRIALGAVEGDETISVSINDVFSSFRPLSDYAAGQWHDAHEQRHERVQVKRLDRILAEHPEYSVDAYLKMDTQGFELEVLEGAGNRLRDFKLIQAELALTPLYQGQRRWTEIVDWMHDRGFRPVIVKENGIDAVKMRTADLDVLFERTDGA